MLIENCFVSENQSAYLFLIIAISNVKNKYGAQLCGPQVCVPYLFLTFEDVFLMSCGTFSSFILPSHHPTDCSRDISLFPGRQHR